MFMILINFILGINFFQGVRGCLKYFWKFRRGGGGVNYVSQKWKFREGGGGGGSHAIPGGGVDIFWNHTIQLNTAYFDNGKLFSLRTGEHRLICLSNIILLWMETK